MSQRRRKRRRRSRRRARLVILACLVSLIFLGALSAVLARDGLRVRDSLQQAQAAMLQARQHATDGDLGAAEASLLEARAQVGEANGHTSRLLWRAAEKVPLAGRTLRTVSATTRLADTSLQFGRSLLGIGRSFVDRDESILDVTDGRLSLAPIRQAAEAIGTIDLEPLQRSVDELASLTSTLVPGEVNDARNKLIRVATSAMATLGRGRGIISVLPAMLGDEAPREYFLAMQNPAELRGTGGFIGYFATVTVDNGRFTLHDPQARSGIDATFGDIADPLGSDEFEARYAPAAASRYLGNVNVDPDVPTTGRALIDLFWASQGRRLDGVIMVDPKALAAILRVIGPVDVDPTVLTDDPRLANPITTRRIEHNILVDQYEVFGGDEPQRRIWQEAVATAVFEAMFSRSWDPVAMSSALARLGGDGHLQVYSIDPEEQAALATVRLGGTLRSTDTEDLFAVTANNVAPNKADAHVAHTLDLDIQLAPASDGAYSRSADLTVTVDNPLPTSGFDDYILGSLPLRPGDPESPPGLSRTWFSIWAPSDAQMGGIQVDSGTQDRIVYDIHDAKVIDHVLDVPSHSSGSFSAHWAGDARIVREPDGSLVYSLRVFRQAKAIPDRVDLAVTVPSGTSLIEVEVDGGGTGSGLGPFGEAGPRPKASVKGDTVRVAGDITSDLLVRVRFKAE